MPEVLNSTASVQAIIDALAKYKDSSDLTIAVYLNKGVRFDPLELVVPNLEISGLYVFGAVSADASKWAIWGDFMGKVYGTTYSHPV